MHESDAVISSISDTALWVACYRAMETERSDAHFHDRFARVLAGPRGEEVIRKMPAAKRHAWAMIVRTCSFDELILRVIQKQNLDCVLNLAAGLDTRPYRLTLPESLRWVEVDLPAILDYKEDKLKDAKPVCRLERIRLDLSDAVQRRELFAQIQSNSKETLVITEGLLVYLTREQVTTLAKDLHEQAGFRWWLIDYLSPRLMRMLQPTWGKTLAAANAPLLFAPKEGPDFYRPLGWNMAEFRSTWEEGRRLNRRMRFAKLVDLYTKLFPKKKSEFEHLSGSVLLRRQ
jgi:methyltransferase (TIGR00027 family)